MSNSSDTNNITKATNITKAAVPWHKESFDAFITERLPSLLAERLPLVGYEVKPDTNHTCAIAVTITATSGTVTVTYTDIPVPSDEGVFTLDDVERVVVPIASSEELDSAHILCVGDQLYDYVDNKLGEAPDGLPWDENLLRSFLPLDEWLIEYINGNVDPNWLKGIEPYKRWNLTSISSNRWILTSIPVDDCNWLARHASLRRIIIPNRQQVISQSQFGRVCPFETPEGHNIGHVLHIALGTAIKGNRLVIIDDSPEAALGLTASMVPFLEHNDSNRQLMGVNMIRQALVPPDPEPAYVQTGNEVDQPDFWFGRNLLTAYISWGPGTFEDAIIISQSAAKKLNYPSPAELGDKLANRHGTKGTISRILPDDEMPHMEDGTPVELLFSFVGIHTRMNLGQLREAVMSRIAKAQGAPAIVPPYHAPTADEMRDRLTKAGLPESGMEILRNGRDGKPLQRPSTVGWVYWGRLFHLARNKIHVSVSTSQCNLQGVIEYHQMRNLGAFETIAETYNTRSANRDDADTLAQRVAKGEVTQAGAPSPAFSVLTKRLQYAGIRTCFDDNTLSFSFDKPNGDTLKLACPIPHPWLRERQIDEVGVSDEIPQYTALVEANQKMQKLLSGHAPSTLRYSACDHLSACLSRWCDALMTSPLDDSRSISPIMSFHNRVMFSGRTVLTVADDLHVDQLCLPEEMAWTLFSPALIREFGDEKQVADRTDAATNALRKLMAQSWIILNRAPTIWPTCSLAFHSVPVPGNAIHLHPLATRLLNADFDGDQAAVFLPITSAGQDEAGRVFSIAAHLKRDPELISWLVQSHEPMWGIADLTRTDKGRKEIEKLIGTDVDTSAGFATRNALIAAMRNVLAQRGEQHALNILEKITTRGFDHAKLSGASMNPFFGTTIDCSTRPDAIGTTSTTDINIIQQYIDEMAEAVTSRTDYDNDDLGPQLLAVKSGARGSIAGHIMTLLGLRILDLSFAPQHMRQNQNTTRFPFILQHGFADGLTPDELNTFTICARTGLGMLASEIGGMAPPATSQAFTILARAMRASRPGVIFARAAATGEVDPLTDIDSRCFVGLLNP